MARTYTAAKALSVLQTQFPRLDQSPFSAQLVDEVVSEIWNAYDWRQAIVELPPFYLVPDEQDYRAPTSAVPTDFLSLREAWVRDVDGVSFVPLSVRGNLPLATTIGFPDSISYESELAGFRVHPRPSASMSSTRYQIEGSYKKIHKKFVIENLNSEILPWDDAYFPTFKKVLLWKYYETMSDPRVLQQQFLATQGIDQMAARESVGGVDAVAPSDALMLW
jgi:hypothetical protein